jgi:hypothetical protein
MRHTSYLNLTTKLINSSLKSVVAYGVGCPGDLRMGWVSGPGRVPRERLHPGQ